MNCPECTAANRELAKFCVNCGARLVVVCPQCGTELPASARFCDGCGARVGAPPPEPSEEGAAGDTKAERLKRLVPKAFAERLLATRGQVQAERRVVTILFSDVKGSTAMGEGLDPEDVMEIMDGAFDVLIAPVYRYEGTLARLMGDAILAFFGAPIAHEDDPEQACRAALEIVEGARAYAEKLEAERGIEGFNVRVGINTGLVVVGEVGSDLRVEYTAMGDAINLAARMEQNAPLGGILITHDTYRHVRGVFDVLPQAPLRVKGKAEPVQTYLVRRAKPRAFRKPTRGVEGIETRMIGRESELSRLQDAFYTAVEDGELQMVTVVGEAGVGKSRLLHEFDLWSEVQPELFFYFKGRARQQTQNLPYALIRDLIAFRFEIRESDRMAVVREKLEAGVGAALEAGESSRMAAHLIGHLVGFGLEDSTYLGGVTDKAQEMREGAVSHLVDYFAALGGQSPVVMLLEDLHWADDSSLDVLNDLALGLVSMPVTIVSTARPSLFERRPHWGEGQAYHQRVPLRRLSKRHSRRLVDEILQRADSVPDSLRDLLVQNAEGNPFFLEELIKMLIEDGLIVAGEDQWHVEKARVAAARVPASLSGVLQARLDGLPPEERAVMQQASVVGRLFWDGAVLRINEHSSHRLPGEEVLGTLSALRGREMVFQRETSAFAGSQEFVFKNALLREATYGSVLKRLRKVYHGLAADWLMEQAGERVSEYTALIADHLELAERSEEAAKWLVQAGDRARRVYAHQQAIDAYQRALALLKALGDSSGAADVLMKLGLTHHSAFDFERSREAYDEAFALQRQASRGAAVSGTVAPHALRTAMGGPTTLDPTLADDVSSECFLDQFFSGLLELTPELGVLPDVAERWEVMEGGRKYVFHLREDVRWSDGVAVTARDFEFAWKRILDPATCSRTARLWYAVQGASDYHQGRTPDGDSVGIRSPDDWTLEVTLERPASYFLHLVSASVAYPVPRHAVRAHGDAWAGPQCIVTNGPFRIESWRPDEAVVLTRRAEYHGRVSGNLERVEIGLITSDDWRTGWEGYRADELDIASLASAPWSFREGVRQELPSEYVLVPTGANLYAVFDVSRPPFDDQRVRGAFALALDRQALMDAVLGDRGVAATGGLVPPGMPGHTPGIGARHDPARAQQLLDQAGYPGGRGFPDVEAVSPISREPLMRAMVANWFDVLGVEFSVSAVDWVEYLSLISRQFPPLHLTGWKFSYPDPDYFLRVPIRLQTTWRHPTYDELIERTLEVTDQAERIRLYGRADRILMREAPVIPIAYDHHPMLIKPWVKGSAIRGPMYWRWKHAIIEPH
ncbi:MAG: ABC transporter substrate-binding protein [Anaerolineae bacterium]|jgi:ABC-type oligopeptide transport system substrate-binding subunit/class 3 adenylate cyclase